MRKITLVDSGKVSMSNPLRQSLYTLDDCRNGGEFKAAAAVKSLQKIFPAVVSSTSFYNFHGINIVNLAIVLTILSFFFFSFSVSGSRICCNGYSNARASCTQPRRGQGA